MESVYLIGIAAYLFTGHVYAGMNIGELHNPQRMAERERKFPHFVRLAGIECAVSGSHEGRGGQCCYAGLKKTTAIRISLVWRHSDGPVLGVG